MKSNGKRTNKPGKTYPESSARQALRGKRRAQGGPGITTGQNPTPLSCGKCSSCSCSADVQNVQTVETQIELTV